MNTFKLEHLTQVEGSIVTNETNLSICLMADGFYFALIDKQFHLRSIGEFKVDLSGGITQVMMNIKTCFTSIGIHIFNFNNIRVVCPTNRNTWIPFKLYDSSKNKEYLSASNAIYSSDTILANTVKKIDAVSIFAYPLHSYSGVKIVMPKANFVCQSQVLAEYAFDVSSFMQNTFVLYKRNNGCDFAIFKGNTFTLSNSFDYKTPNDLIYFILFTLQNLNISSAEVSLLLTGERYTDEELLLFRKYVKNVSYANCLENIEVGIEFDGIDLQKYFLVLA
jgi:hypothetical protein